MPDDSSDPSQPDGENNTPEAPASRPGPLQHPDKSDAGCLILLGVTFIGVFLLPAAAFLGGAPFIIPLVTCLLLVLVTPFINPLERRSTTAKWWGRFITFLVLAAAVAAVAFWVTRGGQMMRIEY